MEMMIYTGAPVQLSVYNDKLMLWNEGRLPQGFTIETLLGKHPSRPFNKNIANVFFKAGFIEAWGRGIAKIINGFTNVGRSAPVFEATMGGILLTIEREDKAIVTENVTENVTNKRLAVIINEIEINPKISYDRLRKILGVARMTVYRDLENLKEEGKIKRIGPAKGGHWEIINDNM